ncbi:MAG: CpsD/CapB family tyrosine-protein kinase [Priestia megaterium]|uniref:CpsD/CapB family tyrosine-protein kinase n=1 Tax=Priestia aryabhattai TaxID=412384 RepID=UPI001C8E6CED|nr:CpsD/CapB family tyrosine-protein kinase [Priestia aryabhattai]MBX9998609.1 CpsD/CapB family tyrosine-protein kinase [Priestia aryabhattai]
MARKKKQNNDKALTAKRRLVTHTNPKLPVAEQYRTIRSNIQFSNLESDVRSLVMTSSGPSEGKSTTAANLAIVYAQQDKKVLLVDADLRKPTAHFSFRLENHIGFTNVLTRKVPLLDAVSETEIPNLSVLTSGPIPPNPSELLASKNMDALLEEMYEHFDFILFDTPPTLAVTDAQILSNKVEATILVVSSGKTDKAAARKAKELLLNAKARLLGVILNDRKIEDGGSYYYYYGTN